ncbi:MAG: hypothetical protein VX317_05400, partial [Verrucomicrobiota bacterium]|nr:hypothetical protein [Verrucomicrobiota bacterium]
MVGHLCWAAFAVFAFGVGAMLDREDTADVREARNAVSKSGVDRGESGAGSYGQTKSRGNAGTRKASGSDSGGPGQGQWASLLTEEQIAAVAREAFRDGNPLVRRRAFDRLLENLTSENAKDMLVHLKKNRVGGDQWRDFHYAWGTIDGKAAVEHASKSEDRDLSYTMAGWASTYPEAAIAHLNNLPEEDKRYYHHLQEALVSGMADNDTARATDYVLQLANEGNDRANHLFGVVTREVVSSVGIEEAAQWSQNLPDGDLKGAALDSVAHSFTNRDPEAAAQWVEQFAGQSFADRAIEEVGDEWAERDPASA